MIIRLRCIAINYKSMTEEQIVNKIKYITGNAGIDLIFDCIGPSQFNLNCRLAGLDSRWVLYGLLSGQKLKSCNFAPFLEKRISLLSMTLRNRSAQFKQILIENFETQILPFFDSGKIKPIIDQVLQINDWCIDALKVFEKAH